jgi:hypothetical protein
MGSLVDDNDGDECSFNLLKEWTLSHVTREIKDRQSEKLICKTCHSLTTDHWKRPGKALFGGRVLPGLR